MRLTAAEIADATGGELLAGTAGALASSFAIDSRVLGPGACFVASGLQRDEARARAEDLSLIHI